MLRLPIQGEREILSRSSAHAGFALPVIGMCKKEKQAHDEREHQAGIQFPYQTFVQALYNKGIREPKASGLPARLRITRKPVRGLQK